MLNKVPEVTLYFWIIKILCTTVGETAADYMNVDLGFGLTNTTYAISALLIVALIFQFRSKKYVPGIYWTAVVLISVVGTLITDNLSPWPWSPRSPSGTPSNGPFRFTRSPPRDGKPSTGSPSCSRLRSAHQVATRSPRPTASASSSRS